MDFDPYRNLRLASEHLESLEGIWIRIHAEVFSTRRESTRMATTETVARHLTGLAMRKNEAIDEASLRVGSRLYSEAYTAARVLGALNPNHCVDSRGRTTLQTGNRLAIARALADSRLIGAAVIDDPTTVLAAAFLGDVPDGVLLAHLGAKDPTIGLVAAALRSRLGTPHSRIVESVLVEGPREQQALAILSIARSERFAGSARVALGPVLDALVPEDVSLCAPGDPRALALALVGDGRSASRIATATAHRPTANSAWALGILGVPATAATLVPALEGPEDVARAALQALYMMTGQVFARGAVREDGEQIVPDAQRARGWLASWADAASRDRFHLGKRLSLDGVESRSEVGAEPPSFRFLAARAKEVFPGFLPDRPRRRGGFFDVLPPSSPIPALPPTPTVLFHERLREIARDA
ncbi:MAG: hypothetical protein U0414_11260 [Polyangiaceae bacterium]